MPSAKERRQQAKAKAQFKKHNKAINAIASFLMSNGDKIKKTVTYSDPKDEKDLNYVNSNMDDILDRLLDGVNTDVGGAYGLSPTSSLMNRFSLNGTSDDELIQLQKDLNGLMSFSANDPNLLSGMSAGDIVEHDRRIDTVLHYCPKLAEALDAKADCVLSADHFDRSFINIVSESAAQKEEVFNTQCDEIKKLYNFEEEADKWYRDAAKYGEQYVYRVPYDRAISRLLKSKQNSDSITRIDVNSNGAVCEGVSVMKFDDDAKEYLENFGEITIEINKSGLVVDAVEECQAIHESAIMNESLSIFNEDAEYEGRAAGSYKRKYDVTMPSDIDMKGFNKAIHGDRKLDITSDGLISSKNSSSNSSPEITVPGTVMKVLPRQNVFPRYINGTCLGYTYVEILNDDVVDAKALSVRNFKTIVDPVNVMNKQATRPDVKKESPDEAAIKFMAKRLAELIDANFVNNNQDISQDIYNILKYNDDLTSKKRIRVTFIPPQDMEHIFFKQDPVTHRGVSDIEDSIIPATLYSAMYITNAIWNLTRAQDKRVYYVKQTVDTNTAQVMMNTIEQIKKGNMGIRQIESIQHILNISGRFNDYLIPTSPSGEEPLRMEILQGQQVELQSELMQVLLESAVTPTGVPLEYIDQRRSVEFATQLTMSNNKFLMDTYKRQSKYQKQLTRTFTVLHNNQYNDRVSLKVKLPPPMFLNITNINQVMMNISDMTSKLVELLGVGYNEEILPYVNKKLTIMYLGSYLDLDEIERIMKEAEHEWIIENGDNQAEE